MTATVRPIVADEVAQYMICLRTAFLDERDVTDEQVAWTTSRLDLDRQRTFGSFGDDGRLSGTAASFATPLTVPGGTTIPIAAVTQASVLPTHRRRGHLTGLMKRVLTDALDRDETATMLIAAEWPIYGRFGYGPATEAAQYRVDTRAASFRDQSAAGTVDLVTREELRGLAPPVFDAHRVHTAGCIGRDEPWWDRLVEVDTRPGSTPPPRRVRAVHRATDGTVDGYVVYDTTDTWTDNRPEGTLQVTEMLCTGTEAYRGLWRFLCEVDLVVQVDAGPRPVDEPLAHLLVNGRAVRQRERSDHMWLRLLDVAGAIGARRYRVDSGLVLEVDDPALGRGGRFALDGGPDGADCRPIHAEPDLVVPVAALGAAYLGGASFAMLAAGGSVEERTPGALARADALFGVTPAPWCSTSF
ncbi:GNAT family N-acetyltransferase [soil metagenome]